MNTHPLAAALMTSQAIMLIARYVLGPVGDRFWAAVWISAATMSTGVCYAITGDLRGRAVPPAASIAFGVVAGEFIPTISSFGARMPASTIFMPFAALVALHSAVGPIQPTAPMWIVSYIAASLIGCALVAESLFRLVSPVAEFCNRFAQRDAALRAIETQSPERTPKVSIHGPCYAEPPELIIATPDTISRLQYPNFEVFVVDNNTKDPDLREPVGRNGDALPGAKAGAVNFALAHTASGAEVIAAVGADYIAAPDFPQRYIPLVDDPRTGFVQTSLDYRDRESSPFVTGVYYDYVVTHKLLQPATNEFDRASSAGTMSLVIREALERGNERAQWSLTEAPGIACTHPQHTAKGTRQIEHHV